MTDDRPDPATLYRDGRERFIELGRSLGEEDGALSVAATPSWSVKDNFSHMAGSADDLLAGRLEGVATDPWTQAQVDARADRSLAEVLDEWAELGPRLDEVLVSLGDAVDPRLLLDGWTHEQDVRGTVARPGGADAAVVAYWAPKVLKVWQRSFERAGLPAIDLRCGELSRPGGDDPAGSLSVDPFTALRVLVGRRSVAQMRALGWDGVDPEPYVARLAVFGPTTIDIADAR